MKLTPRWGARLMIANDVFSSQPTLDNYLHKVFPTTTYAQVLILQDSLSPGCWAWYAEAGSLQSLGSPVGGGYAFCRGGDTATLRYHIYLCLP